LKSENPDAAAAGINANAPAAFNRRPVTVLSLIDATASPPFKIALFTCATDTAGFFAHANAATPATCAVAVDEPPCDQYADAV
jgi:hypothetical protein